MIYLFTTIIGSFILDHKLQLIHFQQFKDITEFQEKEKGEAQLRKKYQQLQPLPPEKYPLALAMLKNKQYFSLFHQQNMALTKQAISSSVNEDNLIIQTISNIRELDSVTNLLSKRLREWHSLYYPELSHQIASNDAFVKLILSKSKTELMKELHQKQSIGAALDKRHCDQILHLAQQIANLYALRENHEQYLEKVMTKYCPNLLALAGVTIGAKLIELAKSLKRLALLPASTIQLLGAEKALFRHLRTKAKSPKHGIIVNHPLVQKASRKERGKAARRLADKLSLCARLDYFKGAFKAEEYQHELEKALA
ncbi:MAG: hypothetical protein Q8R37_03165 [Nanoarchaeota archaeon]|nr:hypothetical protein [Nanoarchaeota archaeon]